MVSMRLLMDAGSADARMLLLGAWFGSVCTNPTNMWPGSCPMLSSCTVHLWRAPVKVVDPWNSETPLLCVAGAVLYLTHVSRSAIWMSAVADVGEYHVNSGLGVRASCRDTTRPGCRTGNKHSKEGSVVGQVLLLHCMCKHRLARE